MSSRAPLWLRDQPVAHRGLHGDGAPENSLAAFDAAAHAGYAIEFDVQRLADGGVAVFHDDELERMTGVGGHIAQRSSADLHELALAGTSERIPLLAEALARVDGRVPVLVEIKNRGPVGALESAVVHALTGYGGAVAVQSFNPLSLAFFARVAPSLPRGQLAGSLRDEHDLALYKKVLLRRLMLCPLSRPCFIAYELEMLPYWVVSAWRRALAAPLLAWTVRDQSQLAHARRVADNVIFEGVRP